MVLFVVITSLTSAAAAEEQGRWSVEKANIWFVEHGWLRGCNYIPSTAVNQLEMWQADTFDEKTIDRELGYAQSLGFNSVRVFLHDLLWKQDQNGFTARIERFLAIAERHQIKVLFVLFDSCWYPLPKLGKQPAPLPFKHNSGWVQSPGVAALCDTNQIPRLKSYVTGMLRHFASDHRIVGWDLYNEPDNWDGGAPARRGLEPRDKFDHVNRLLAQTFAWARAVNPSQPLTSGVWRSGNWADDGKLTPTERLQLENSDVISFHCYENPAGMKRFIAGLRRFDRPLLCTEFMARPAGSTFDPILGDLKEQKVAAYCWGFVSGKSQTIYPWDSWTRSYTNEPPLWFHDILRQDGTPYRNEETDYIRRITDQVKTKKP